MVEYITKKTTSSNAQTYAKLVAYEVMDPLGLLKGLLIGRVIHVKLGWGRSMAISMRKAIHALAREYEEECLRERGCRGMSLRTPRATMGRLASATYPCLVSWGELLQGILGHPRAVHRNCSPHEYKIYPSQE